MNAITERNESFSNQAIDHLKLCTNVSACSEGKDYGKDNLREHHRNRGYPSHQGLLGVQQHQSHQGDQQVQSHHGFLWVPLCQLVQKVQEVQSYPIRWGEGNLKLAGYFQTLNPASETSEKYLQRGREVQLCQQHQGSQWLPRKIEAN